MTVLHATCISLEGVGVLLRGPSASGKSDLALRLIDEGAKLVSDDYCDVSSKHGVLTAAAPKTLVGKLEVRGIGIIPMTFEPATTVGLVVDLAPHEQIPRLPETLRCTVEHVSLPWIQIDATSASAAAKVKLAVRKLVETDAIVEDLND